MTDHKRGKKIELLNALQVEQAKYKEARGKGGNLIGNRLADGAALFLYITPNNSKSWRFEYRFPKGGKRHVLVYGSYPDLSLSDARKRHSKARLQLADGLNPTEEKKREAEKSRQEQAREQAGKKNIFRNVAADWLKDEIKAKPKSTTWKCNIDRWLEWANDEIGNRPLPEVEAGDVLAIIKRVADRGNPASAEFCRQTISRVFNYGIRTLRAPRGFNPAEAVKGAVIVPEKKHRPKLNAGEIPALLSDLDKYQGPESVKIGLQILLHCFPRKGELAEAPWKEIDTEAALWSIAAGRMKMKEDHVIPLSPQVVAMFRRLKVLAGDSDFVFPSRFARKAKQPIGKEAFNHALNGLGYKGKFGPHGVRSTAASILADAGFDVNVIDAQLAHKQKNQTRAAYFRNQYLEKRGELLRHWSNLLDGFAAKGANVVPIGAGKAA